MTHPQSRSQDLWEQLWANKPIHTRIASNNLEPLLEYLVTKEPAVVILATAEGGMDLRVYCSKPLDKKLRHGLDQYIQGLLNANKVETYGNCEDKGGALFTYKTLSAWNHIKDSFSGKQWNKMPFRLLLDQRPSTYPEAERHHITLDARGRVLDVVKKVLLAIQNLGNAGHSTSIDIDGKSVAYVDGDGSDRTPEITVDGKVLRKEARLAARVATRWESQGRSTY